MKPIFVLCGVVLASAALAQTAADTQLLSLAAQARARGCGGHAGTGAPLRLSPALSRAAARIAKGEPALAAVEREGYRPLRVFHSNFVGYRTAADVTAALSQHYCSALADSALTDLGFLREGNHWLLVLAAPFELPQLADRQATIARVLSLTNEARSHARRCGDRAFESAPAVRWNPLLEEAAAHHAQDMAAYSYLEHQGRDGSTPAQRITRAGYRWRAIGENVASGQRSAQEVVDDWVSSPGHCANLMDPAFTEMGAAFAVNMKTEPAVYWAQEFGKPR